MPIIDNDIKFLIELLKKKKQLLSEIHILTNSQTFVITEEDMDKLNELIKDKGIIIEKIDNLDKQFSNHFDRIKDIYNVNEIGELDLNKDLSLELKNNTEDIFRIMQNIYQVEKLNKDKINKKFQDVKLKLKGVKNEKKVSSGYYSKTSQTQGYFIDQKK